MKVVIKVSEGESAKDAKRLEKLIRELNFAPHVITQINYASEYGEAGHSPFR